MTTRKLQVFVSSTYIDLKMERQAAVEAILTAGHIPAGMELFAAGDKSQMDVIRRWIDESDVLLLILGGRYGSLEKESKKSYIQLEYEYALAKGKPVFSVLISNEHLAEKIRAAPQPKDVLEQDNPHLLNQFKDLVTTKLIRYWSSPADIKVAILESLASFAHRGDLSGWVRWSEIDNFEYLREENKRLAAENRDLRQRLASERGSQRSNTELGLDEMVSILMRRELQEYPEWMSQPHDSVLQNLTAMIHRSMEELGHTKPTVLHLLWGMRRHLAGGTSPSGLLYSYMNDLFYLGLLTRREVPDDTIPNETMMQFTLSQAGRSFLLMLEAKLAATTK